MIETSASFDRKLGVFDDKMERILKDNSEIHDLQLQHNHILKRVDSEFIQRQEENRQHYASILANVNRELQDAVKENNLLWDKVSVLEENKN